MTSFFNFGDIRKQIVSCGEGQGWHQRSKMRIDKKQRHNKGAHTKNRNYICLLIPVCGDQSCFTARAESHNNFLTESQ
jgi:hypothetical protein